MKSRNDIMTSNENKQAGYATLTGGPIPLDEALFYAYPRDLYVWELPSEGGSGIVGPRRFDYDTVSGTVFISFGGDLGIDQKSQVNKKQSQSSAANKTVYFKVQAGDTVQLIDFDRWELYEVTEKKLIFNISDQNNPTATVEVTARKLLRK
jgi:hypothetical protein